MVGQWKKVWSVNERRPDEASRVAILCQSFFAVANDHTVITRKFHFPFLCTLPTYFLRFPS